VEDSGSVITLRTLQREKGTDIVKLGREQGATSIRVFGSVAGGDNREASDVDLLVEFEKGRTLFDLIDLRLDLRDLLGVEVDIVTPNSLHYLRDSVLAEAKAI
jgi:predicted nucleotidyltransferase